MENARKNWLDRHIPDLKGQRILITGATSGIGFEAALGLAYKGAQITIACRSLEKAQKALGEIQKEIPTAKIDFVYYDQGDLASIAKMAEKIKEVDFSAIVLNAGVYFPTEEMEHASVPSLTFRTNGVGTFACYEALVKNHGKARFVFVNSLLNHSPKKHDYAEHLRPNSFSRTTSYAVSKRAVMNTFFLALNTGVPSYLTHPGVTKTNILHSYAPFIKRLGNGFMYFFSHKAWKASLGIVLAAAGNVPSGSYVVPRGLFHVSGFPKTTYFPRKKCAADSANLMSSLHDNVGSDAPRS